MKKPVFYKGYEIEKTEYGIFHVSNDDGGCGHYPTLKAAKHAIDTEFFFDDYQPE